jgi:ankyrin repeat protein
MEHSAGPNLSLRLATSKGDSAELSRPLSSWHESQVNIVEAINARDEANCTPHCLAVLANGPDAVVVLLPHGADIDPKAPDECGIIQKDGDNALCLAAWTGHSEVMRVLMSVNATFAADVLYHAAENRHLVCINEVLQRVTREKGFEDGKVMRCEAAGMALRHRTGRCYFVRPHSISSMPRKLLNSSWIAARM